jgi:hypothetical protein
VFTLGKAYLAAVCETDDAKMMGRILEARAAIEQRLLAPIEEDSLEHRELLAAQKALEVLLEGVGHFPTREAPECVTKALIDHLA